MMLIGSNLFKHLYFGWKQDLKKMIRHILLVSLLIHCTLAQPKGGKPLSPPLPKRTWLTLHGNSTTLLILLLGNPSHEPIELKSWIHLCRWWANCRCEWGIFRTSSRANRYCIFSSKSIRKARYCLAMWYTYESRRTGLLFVTVKHSEYNKCSWCFSES